jgi:DNA modification methylase
LIELDPKYVDVIIRRWQEFTGREAQLSETGQTFEDVKRQREAGHAAIAV